MGLGRAHAGLARQVLQRHRPAVVRQRTQQLAADLDALDAALQPGRLDVAARRRGSCGEWAWSGFLLKRMR